MFFFVVLAAAASYRTSHPLDSIVELLNLLAYATLFMVSAHGLGLERLKPLLLANTVTVLAVSAVGVLEYHDLWRFLSLPPIPSNGRPSATFGYRNFAAMYLVCAVPITVLHFVGSVRSSAMALSGCAAALGSVFLFYTRTRGAWAGLAAAAFLTAAAFVHSPALRSAFRRQLLDRARLRRFVVACGCIALAVGLAPLPARFQDAGLQRFDEKKADITTTVASAFDPQADRGRRQMWFNTWALITDHLLLGVGPGGWKRIYPAYDGGAMIRDRSSPRRPHNDYLWIASETGLLGLAAYLCFVASTFVALWRSAHRGNLDWSIAAPFLAAAILATLGHAMFSFPRERPQAQMFLFLLSGIAAGTVRTGTPHRIPGRLAVPLLVLAIGIPAATSVLCWQRISFDRHFLGALLATDSGNNGEALSRAQAALQTGNFRPHALIVSGRELERGRRYSDAEEAYQRALDLAPYSWHALNGLGVGAKHRGELAEAEEHYQRALEIFPASVAVRNNLGALYRSMGKPGKAAELYRSVLGGQPGHVGALNNLGNLYKARGDLDSAAVFYKRALVEDPELPQAHYNLADVYRIRGRLSEAAQHYRSATETKHTTSSPETALLCVRRYNAKGSAIALPDLPTALSMSRTIPGAATPRSAGPSDPGTQPLRVTGRQVSVSKYPRTV